VGRKTLTESINQLDLDNVKLNQRAKYPGQRSFNTKVIVHTHTHTHMGPVALPGPLKWSVTRKMFGLILQASFGGVNAKTHAAAIDLVAF